MMLFGNINPSLGMCNGTWKLLTHLGNYIMEGNIMTGSKIGTKVLILRIILTSLNQNDLLLSKGDNIE